MSMEGTQKRQKATRSVLRCIDAEELLADIRRKCLDCCCGSRNMVEGCQTPDCHLYKWRNAQAVMQTAMFGNEEQLPGQVDMFGSEMQ